MSCRCQNCGQPYKIDVNIPDDLWKLIKGNTNLLCGRCIFKRLEFKLDDHAAFQADIVPIEKEEIPEINFEPITDNLFNWGE